MVSSTPLADRKLKGHILTSLQENEQTMDAIQQKEEIQPVEDASAGEVPEYRADVRVKIKSGTVSTNFFDSALELEMHGTAKVLTALVPARIPGR